MGNISESGARDVVSLIESHFLKEARPLEHEEIPQLLSLQMPTHDEAVRIFGSGVDPIVPLKVQEVVSSDAEENHAVELILQTASQHQLGHEGVAFLELIGHMAYNSAFDQLRTKEQLGTVIKFFIPLLVTDSLLIDFPLLQTHAFRICR
jgi:insulysin